MYSSSATTTSPLREATVNGVISSLKRPAFCAASALFCEAEREAVLLLAADLPFGGDVLGRVAHVIAVEGVDQAVLEHGVDQLQFAHFDAGAQIGAVRGLRHQFLTAGDDDFGVAVADLLQAERDRAQAAAAQLVEAEGGLFLRHARLHRRLARRLLALPAREDLPEDDFVDVGGLDLGERQSPT